MSAPQVLFVEQESDMKNTIGARSILNHKSLLSFLSLCAVAMSSSVVNATVYQASGLVKGIYTSNSAYGTNTDHFTVVGFYPDATGGNCGAEDGYVGIALADNEKGKRQLAMIIAAQIAGRSVNVRVDNANKNDNQLCYLWILERID
jgi:hypothetical protein